ncbi:MAG: hypothetical protein ACPG8W_22100 [Candidatus Promineifilaceae bacterium]
MSSMITPAFYNPAQIGSLFYPNMGEISAAAEAAQLPWASADKKNIHLVLIDMQVDFCHEQGNLYVPGSLDDIERVCAFIMRHAANITQITSTLDSHVPFQIFHPPWWVDAAGNHPAPFTLIKHQDILDGTWRAVVAEDYSAEYCRLLEASARKVLTIWPYHVLIGGPGNMLDPMLWSMVTWHALARQTQPNWVTKGTLAQTENYSAIKPEIPVANHPSMGRAKGFLQSLDSSDLILLAGEAESHCVLATLADMVAHFADQPEKRQQIYVLKDCMSPVQHPEVDFHALALAEFEQFAAQGVNFINSTDDLPIFQNSQTAPETAVHGVKMF